MSGVEGELKKRLASPCAKAFWTRYAYTHRKEDGSFPSQNEYIFYVINEAAKELPKSISMYLEFPADFASKNKEKEDYVRIPAKDFWAFILWTRKWFGEKK